MTDSYEELLDKGWDALPTTKLLPTGTWRLKGANGSFIKAKEPGQSDKVIFTYHAQEPEDDVDPEALEALGEGYDISTNRLYATFWVEGPSDWEKVRKHLAKHGINPEHYKTIRDSLKAVRGCPIRAFMGVRTYVDSMGESQTVNELTAFTPISEP